MSSLYAKILANYPEIKTIKKEYKWYYYKGGKSFGPFDSKPDEKLVEKICINEDKVQENRQQHQKRSKLLFKEYYTQLFNYYNHNLNEEQFDLCYNMAYHESHAYGYHEVENKLSDIIDFATSLLKIKE